MTSNVGAKLITDKKSSFGFSAESSDNMSHEKIKESVLGELKQCFKPEFLNRIDDIVMFDALDKDAIFKIIDIELAGFLKRIDALGFKLNITDGARTFIANKGYDVQYGARPLKRAIQKYLEDELAELIISESITPGDTINVDYNEENDKISTSITRPTNNDVSME